MAVVDRTGRTALADSSQTLLAAYALRSFSEGGAEHPAVTVGCFVFHVVHLDSLERDSCPVGQVEDDVIQLVGSLLHCGPPV